MGLMRTRKLRSHLLLSTATLASALAVAGIVPAQSQNATWSNTPGSGDFNTGSNWVSVPPNTVPTGTAFFDASNITSLTFSLDTDIGGWTFNAGAPAFDFTNNARVLTFDGAGIAINGGGATLTNSNFGFTNFNGSSTAGGATINNNSNGTVNFNGSSNAGSGTINASNGATFFNDNSSAGSVTINNNAGGNLQFLGSSTAGSATINNRHFTRFFGSSSAGNAFIRNFGFDQLLFFGASTAGSATIVNNISLVQFHNSSTAGDATINNSNNGRMEFLGSSSAGNATIFGVGGDVFFEGTSTAGNATITNSSDLEFSGNSTAANATITNVNGSARFLESSTAGSATIINESQMFFDFAGGPVESPSAGSATITNRNLLFFNGASTAATATITNENTLRFQESSSAGSATIANNNILQFQNSSSAGISAIINNGILGFDGASSAGTSAIINNGIFGFDSTSSADNAIITNNAGLVFLGTSTGGQAQIMTNAGGETDFSASGGPLADQRLTAGSLAGSGSYFLGANELTVGGNNRSTEVGGVISDCGPTGNDCRNAGATGGSLVKTGGGVFTLSGANTYTGPTTVNEGTLIVNGSVTSDVTVNGGMLGGTGQIGGLIVNAGGTLAPGNSIGTMTVNGPFTLGSGAIYEVEANAGGQSDTVIVNGTVNLTGATLRVLAAGGAYQDSTDYTIIDNDGTDAVVGVFGTVTTNLAFLIPTVFYNAGDGNDVVLNLERNATLFQDVAKTKNQKAVAGALGKFPTDNPLFLAVLNQTAAGARQAFDALSGEIHATVAGTLSDDSRYVREAVLGRLMQASHTGQALSAGGPQVASYDSQAYALGYDGKSLIEPESAPLAFWTQGYGAWGDFDSDGNAASADRDLGGFISGMDADIGQAFGGSWRAGLATGASFSSVDVNARFSSADVETYHLGGYIGGMAGAFALRGGGMWAWSEIDTSRAVVFPGFYERQKANYDADTGQLFGEIAYPTQMGGIALEPFGGLAFVSVDTDSFTERGGPEASLRGVNLDQDVGYTSLGLRAATTMHWGQMLVTPHISAAWLHAFDDVTPGASLAFATTGIGFAIDGVPLAEDSALLDAGLDFAMSDRVSAGVSYTGQFSDNVTDNGVKGRFTWLFN